MTAPARITFNWRVGRHWSTTEKPCRRCGGQTHLYDADGGACHKVCAEDEANQRLARAAAAYTPRSETPSAQVSGDAQAPA